MKDVIAFLRQNDNFLLLTHRRPDGDTLGSSAALCAGLRTLGKTAYLWRNPEITERHLTYTEAFLAPDSYCHDTVIAVDIASRSMLSKDWSGTVQWRIDHHPGSDGFADKYYTDPSAAACGEVVLEILRALGVPLTKEIAKPLYIAISTDTGCFRFANTTAQTHRAAADLLETGIPANKLDTIFFAKTRARMAAEAAIIGGMEYAANGLVALAMLTLAKKREICVAESDLDGLSNLPLTIEGIGVGFMMREDIDGWRISCRTAEPYAANAICGVLGGGGHARAAGAEISERLSPDAARERVLVALWEIYPELR